MSNKTLALDSPLRYLENTPLVVGCLLIFDSLHFVFARLLLPHLPPTTSSLYVMGIATVEVAIYLHLKRDLQWQVLRRHLWFFLGIGGLVAVSTVLTFQAVAYIDPGAASLLNRSAILYGVGLGVLWLRERMTRLQAVGALVAIAGVVIITFQPGDYLRFGSLLVLIASLLYALHNALFKRYGGQIDLANFFLFRLGATTAFLLVITAARSELLIPLSPQAWIILFLTGTVNIVLSRTLYYLTLKRLNLSMHSIVLTLSPVVAVGWTLLLFGIYPMPQQLIGGLAVIAGVMLTVNKGN